MKERFSAEEWADLMFLPVAVFFMVAGADGKVDQKEILAFATDVGQGALLKDELHRELAIDVAGNIQSILQRVSNLKLAQNFVERTKGFLRAKLSEEEYQRFTASLFISGVKIAKASGGGFLGLGDKVSKEEKTALAVFAASWGLDPQSLSKYFN
jgi:hypothetical protein